MPVLQAVNVRESSQTSNSDTNKIQRSKKNQEKSYADRPYFFDGMLEETMDILCLLKMITSRSVYTYVKSIFGNVNRC